MNPKAFKNRKSLRRILGNNVTRLREYNKLSTKELAEEILGFSEEELLKIESCESSDVNIEHIVDIARFFNVSLDSLIKDDYLIVTKVER